MEGEGGKDIYRGRGQNDGGPQAKEYGEPLEAKKGK